MQLVCPNCDVIPKADAAAGSPCASCRTPLVKVVPEEDLVGKVIDDRFEITARLGKGGMGTVYRAKQRSIGREVALKLIDRKFESDVTAVKRFMREAQLASQLSHPNTVGVIEFGQDKDGRLYLAMELVKGRTLYEVMKRDGAMSLSRVVRIAAQLCDALEAAHALSIIHRDLKHENVMVLDGPVDRDLVKILDFGLARLLDTSAENRATATGVIAGSPRYLPPEVALEAAPPAPSQDIYSLGVMLAEMALDRPLWDAPTIDSLFAMKLTTPPKLDGLAPEFRELLLEMLGPAITRPPANEVRKRMLAFDKPGPATIAGSHGSVALDATRQVGPPSVRFNVEPAATIAAPTTSAFSPEATAEPALELEREWHEEKQAKQDRLNAPPPKRPLKIMGVIAALIAIGIVATGVVMIVNHKSEPAKAERPLPPTANMVSIEIRAIPTAKITIDGHVAGTTPLTLHVKRSITPVMIEAQIRARLLTKQVTPDHDQTIDFP